MNTAGLLLVTGLVLSAGSPGADKHLLAGATLFREARYAEALVEFRVAQKLGAPEAGQYVGVTLVRLERPEEAIEAFGGVEGSGADALVDYYRALAAVEARLYLAADRLLAAVGDRSGPRIAGQAARLRADIAAALAREPTTATIDWYLARCAEHRSQGRAALARATCAEAEAHAARRSDHYRRAEAQRGATASPAQVRQ